MGLCVSETAVITKKLNNKAKSNFKKAEKLFNLAKYSDAIQLLEKAIHNYPEYSEAFYLKGRCLGRLGKEIEAIKCYDEAIKLTSHISAHIFKAKLLSGSEESQELYKKAIELNTKPETAIDMFNMAASLYGLEKYGDSLIYFQKSIELKPSSDALSGMANNLFILNEHILAFIYYEKAIQLNPNDDVAHYLKADAFFNLEKYEQSIECLNKAIEIYPHPGYFALKGRSYFLLHNFDESLEWFSKAIAIDPECSIYYFYKANAYWVSENLEESLLNCNKAIELNNSLLEAYKLKAEICSELKNKRELVECYSRIIDLNPSDYETMNNKGVVLHELNQFEDAIKCYDQATEANPLYSLAYKNKSEALNRLSRFDEANLSLIRANQIVYQCAQILSLLHH